MKIYLAGPISGRSYEEVVGLYRQKTTEIEALGYEVLCPMTGKEYLRNEVEFKSHGFDNPVSSNRAIYGRDKWMVKQADVVLADLRNSGDRVSIGTCMELALADDNDKHVITVMQDDNIHQHAFVLQASDIIFPTYEEALDYLARLTGGINHHSGTAQPFNLSGYTQADHHPV